MRFLASLKVFDVRLIQETRMESVALLCSFSAAGVNGRRVRGYVHVQLCSFLNYAG